MRQWECVSMLWAGPHGLGISCMLVVVLNFCFPLTWPNAQPNLQPLLDTGSQFLDRGKAAAGVPLGPVERRLRKVRGSQTGLGITEAHGRSWATGNVGDSWSWVSGRTEPVLQPHLSFKACPP